MDYSDVSGEVGAALDNAPPTAPAAPSSPYDDIHDEVRSALAHPEGYYGGQTHLTITPAPTFKQAVTGAVTNYVPNVIKAGSDAVQSFRQNLLPTPAENQQFSAGVNSDPVGAAVGNLESTAKGIAAIPQFLAAPITGAIKSVAPIISAPFTSAIQSVGEPIAKALNPNAQLPSREDVYNQTNPDVETALGLVTPKYWKTPQPIVGTPPAPPPNVLLSQGQQTGDINLIRQEQAAYRGQLGPGAQERAGQFFDQQKQQVQDLTNRVGQSFDALGQNVANDPHDAASIVQGSLQRTKQIEKAAVNVNYDTAKGYGGEIDADAFRNMGSRIRSDLSFRPDPVIVDDKLTPWASKAISEIDNASIPNIQNRADPFGAPDPSQIKGVSLEGVDQVRKRLVQLRSGAYGNNASDGRSASAVLRAYDDHITQAVNSGQFRGDPRAVQAFNDARASAAEFQKKFGTDNQVGKQIEKIIGPRNGEPLTPNDVADALFGKSGTNPGSTNVGVANRVKNILGENSTEWSAVKQGLFSRLIERGHGEAEMGSGMIANRIAKFLNSDGRDMANAVYSPPERNLIRQFGELQRKLEVPKTGFNTSDTATFLSPILRGISDKMAYAAGFAIAHAVGAGTEGKLLGAAIAGKGSEIVQNLRNVKQMTAQMPMAAEALDKWKNAVAAFHRANSPSTRVALATSTNNMVRAFKPLGITFQPGAVGATADQQQNQQ